MPSADRPFVIATRGSALALAQAHATFDQCRLAFPDLRFEIKVIKTTGDKLQRASMAQPDPKLPKGLFTKELEVALLKGRADLAVHSLKDLPTDLPTGLTLGAVSARADVRDVLIYRDASYLAELAKAPPTEEWTPGQSELQGFGPGLRVQDLPGGAQVGTSSPRRAAQLLALNPALRVVEIRGNVITRLQKLAQQPDLSATILAAAGLQRLNFKIGGDGRLSGDAVPDGLLGTVLGPDMMLPCVGQAALGIEIREGDERAATVCQRLNHYTTYQCVTAERAFLQAMGGGCQSPVGAYAEVTGDRIQLRAVSFHDGAPRRAEVRGDIRNAAQLGAQLADQLRPAAPARPSAG
jgi:hydroxymethylbilane synthase